MYRRRRYDEDDKLKIIKERGFDGYPNPPYWYERGVQLLSEMQGLANDRITQRHIRKVEEYSYNGWTPEGFGTLVVSGNTTPGRQGRYLVKGKYVIFVDTFGQTVRVRAPEEKQKMTFRGQDIQVWKYMDPDLVCIRNVKDFQFKIISFDELTSG